MADLLGHVLIVALVGMWVFFLAAVVRALAEEWAARHERDARREDPPTVRVKPRVGR